MKVRYFVLAFFLFLCTSVFAVSLPEESFVKVVKAANSVLLIELTKAELVREGDVFCGIRYTADVERVIKGSPIKSLNFVTSDSLPVLGRYVIVLSDEEKAANKSNFIRGTHCKKNSDEWYFWAGVGRRYFNVDEYVSRLLKKGDVIAISKYSYGADNGFIAAESIPEEIKDRFSTYWFFYVNDLTASK